MIDGVKIIYNILQRWIQPKGQLFFLAQWQLFSKVDLIYSYTIRTIIAGTSNQKSNNTCLFVRTSVRERQNVVRSIR